MVWILSIAATPVDSYVISNSTVTATQISVTRDSTNVESDEFLLRRGYKQDLNSVNRVTCQYVVAHIDTNVVVAYEGSLDGTNWTNLDEDGNTTVTANGAYMFHVTGISSIPYHRINIVSCQGDSTTTIDATFKFGE